jgi:GPH family glycoside/pentoside/hexuronide:cation symporter
MFGLFYYLDELESSMLVLFGFMFIGIIIGLILFVVKGTKYGVKKSMMIMQGIFSLCCFIILFFGRFLIPTAIGFIGIGIGLAGGLYLIPMMNGDVIDKDEETTGERREGMYAGVNSFITKYAISISQAVFLSIIGFFGFNPALAQGAQSFNAETGIIIGWMLIPAILLLICFIVLKWYPLAGPEWQETKAKIAEIHKQKEIETLNKLGYKYSE